MRRHGGLTIDSSRRCSCGTRAHARGSGAGQTPDEPLYANLRGLPPLLAQVGEDELLLDDARRLVERAEAAGVDATLEVWPGLWHIFALQGTYPESRQAMQRLGRFLRRHVEAHAAPS